MSFIFPGWYLIEYGAGADTERITGFIEGGTDIGGESFLRLESSVVYGKRVRHIRVGLIRSLEEMAAPEKTGRPPEEAVKIIATWTEPKPTERVESTFPPTPTPLPLAVRVDWLCEECEHSLDSHASNGRCGYVILVPDEDDPFAEVTCPCRVNPDALTAFFALDAQARLASIREQARECVESITKEDEAAAKEFFSRSLNNEQILPVGPPKEEQPEAEEQRAADFRKVCKWCRHTQDCHSVDAGGKVICGMCEMVRDVCPAPRGEPALREATAQEAEEQIAADFRKVCKWCHHSQAWHPVSGGEMTTCGMMDCRCPVMRGDPVFREAEKEGPPYAESGKGAPDATREVGEVSLTHKGEDTEQAASGRDDFDTFLTDTLAAAGIDKPAFVQWWKEKDKAWATAAAKTQQQQGAALADFERTLGEVRAEVLRACEEEKSTLPFAPRLVWTCGTCGHPLDEHGEFGPCGEEHCMCVVSAEALAAFNRQLNGPGVKVDARGELEKPLAETPPWPPFRTCIDCGDPWIWHEAVLGNRCAGLNCECRNTREDAERFREEVDQPKAENARRVERNVL